jgi:hypothetical protein
MCHAGQPNRGCLRVEEGSDGRPDVVIRSSAVVTTSRTRLAGATQREGGKGGGSKRRVKQEQGLGN